MTIEIRTHRPGDNLDDFIRLQDRIFKDDGAYIAPLEFDLRDRLNPKKNPYFQHAEAIFFTAWRDGKCVGRCSAQVDRAHLEAHKDDAGFFGFFDTIDDAEVAEALMEAASDWLRARGMKTIRGPYSLSINDEVGLLVDGFEHPPVIMMPHSRPYQHRLVEAMGFEKAQDLFAWNYIVEDPPARAKKAHAQICAMPEVSFRSVNRKKLDEEVKLLLEIFNDAWSENWGFVPLTEAEVKKMAEDLLLILDPEIAFFAEIDGRPVAICLALPNLNEAIRDLNGKLLPFGFLKLLYRLKIKKVRSARLVILGIRRELRGVKRYGGLSTAMYVELVRRGSRAGYTSCELGWTLEENRLINLGIKAMRGKVYKTYRIYEKSLV